MHNVAQAVVHSREDQLTLLKDVNSKVGLNSRAIVEVMSRLSNFSKEIQTEFAEINRHWTAIFDELLKYIYVCNEVRHLGQVMDEAKLRIVEFRQALEVVKSHRLSSKLLPPSEFHSILVNIGRLLPIDVHFAVPVNVEDLFLYYDLCDVQVVSTRTSIRLIVTIPLTSTASQFETYKIHNIPVFNEHLSHWLTWQLDKEYLLISNDRQYYLPVTNQELNNCNKNIYFWCSNISRVRRNSVNDCYFLFFMGDESSKLCPKIIKTNAVSPYLVRNGNNWIYSTDKICKITLKCWNSRQGNRLEPHLIDDIKLTKTGILSNVSKCEIFGSTFRIFPRIQGNVKYQKQLNSLHIPQMQGMLSLTESKSLTLNNDVTFETLSKLKLNLGNDTVEIRLNTLLNELNQPETFQLNYNNYTAVSFILCIIISSILLFVVCICFRKANICLLAKRSRRRQRPPPNDPPNSATIQISQALQELVQSRQATTSSS